MSYDKRFTDMGFMTWYGEPSLMDSAHRHNEVEINFLESGAMHYWLGAGTIELPIQKLVVFWATIPHQLIYLAPNTRFHWVTIPLNWFLQWRLSQTLTEAILNGDWLIDLAPTALDTDLLKIWHRDYHSQESERQSVLLLELEARLARLGLSVGAAKLKSKHTNSHAEAMGQWIAQHYQEAIGVNEIAASVNLHPNYAMRLFQQSFGRSMLDVLSQQRLAEAQRLLVTTKKSVLEIAIEVGFGSLSRFYAVFKERCGQSPKAYREKMGR